MADERVLALRLAASMFVAVVTSDFFERSSHLVEHWLRAMLRGADDDVRARPPLGDEAIARMLHAFHERLGGAPGLQRLATALRCDARPHDVLTACILEMMWDAYAGTAESVWWERFEPPRLLAEEADEDEDEAAVDEEEASFPALEALVKRVIAARGHAVADRMLLYYTSAEERLACERRLRALLHEDAPR